MKRPAFQFYPADWRKDIELGQCKFVARGVWWEMLCVMHECRPYGHLSNSGQPMPLESAAELCRVPFTIFAKAVEELERNRVFSRLPDGTIYSRRMVRDEHIRNVRAAAGKQGGNPVLLGMKDKQNAAAPPVLLNLVSNLRPTPAFAFAFASASEGQDQKQLPAATLSGEVLPADLPTRPKAPAVDRRGSRLPDNWTPPDSWLAWAGELTGWDPQRVMRVAVVFRDYWIAQPGQRAVKANWGATWRNWIRRESARA